MRERNQGFIRLYEILRIRHDIRHRLSQSNILGISGSLDIPSPLIEVNGQRFVNRMDEAEFSTQLTARGTEPKDVADAQAVENFDFHFYHRLRRDADEEHRRALDQMTFYCYGILRLDFVPDVKQKLVGGNTAADVAAVLQSEPAFQDMFLTLRCPDLTTVAVEPDLSAVCEVGEVKISDLLLDEDEDSDLRAWVSSDTMPGAQTGSVQQQEWERTATLHHLEDSEYIYDIVTRTNGAEPHELQVIENFAHRPWYEFIPGALTSEIAPHERFLPLVAPLYPLIQKLNIIELLITSGALVTGRPVWQRIQKGRGVDLFQGLMQARSDDLPVVRFDLTKDTLPDPGPGHEWAAVPVPDQSHLVTIKDRLEQQMREVGYPLPLSPQGESATSGYDRATQIEVAAGQLKPALKNVARAWKGLLQLKDDIIRGLDVPITLSVQQRAEGEGGERRITLRPEMLKEHDRTVSFKSEPMGAKLALRESNLGLVERGFMSRASFMAGEYDDPQAEEDKIELGALSDIVRQAAVQALQQMIQQQAPIIMSQALAEAGVPLPTQPGGGPAPGEEVRNERPPEPFPGAGSPPFPPEQTPPGAMAPPSVGMQTVAQAP